MNAKRQPTNFEPQTLFTCERSRLRPASIIKGWQEMWHSDAVGVDILYDTSGDRPFGMGIIEFPPHGEVPLHVHEGSHILVCFDGEALVKVQVCDGDGHQSMVTHSISIGQCYNIESMVPHSVHAGANGVLLLVVGNDYRMAANQDRLEVING